MILELIQPRVSLTHKDQFCINDWNDRAEQSKTDGNDQESIQSRTTPGPGYHMGK